MKKDVGEILLVLGGIGVFFFCVVDWDVDFVIGIYWVVVCLKLCICFLIFKSLF